MFEFLYRKSLPHFFLFTPHRQVRGQGQHPWNKTHMHRPQGLTAAPQNKAISDMLSLLCLSREPSSHLMDINVRQTPGYKKSHPHSAYGHSTTPIYQRPSANTELFIVDSLTVSLMYAGKRRSDCSKLSDLSAPILHFFLSSSLRQRDSSE